MENNLQNKFLNQSKENLKKVSKNNLTLEFSTRLVTMTMEVVFCSQTIVQKSIMVFGSGPCVAMYSLSVLSPCNCIQNHFQEICISVVFFYYYYLFGIKTHTRFEHKQNKSQAQMPRM